MGPRDARRLARVLHADTAAGGHCTRTHADVREAAPGGAPDRYDTQPQPAAAARARSRRYRRYDTPGQQQLSGGPLYVATSRARREYLSSAVRHALRRLSAGC